MKPTANDENVASRVTIDVMEMFGATAEAGWTFAELQKCAQPLEALLARALKGQREKVWKEAIQIANRHCYWGGFENKRIVVALKSARSGDKG